MTTKHNSSEDQMARRGVNKVILVGNAGIDPETRYMPNGTAVVTLSLATSESWKDKNTGQPQERTEWHRIVFFNRLAEIVSEYVRKGSKLYIEGSLRTRSWEKDGVTRYATEIVASEMQMLDSRQQDSDGLQSQQYSTGQHSARQGSTSSQAEHGGAYSSQQQSPPAGGFDDFDDSIPF